MFKIEDDIPLPEEALNPPPQTRKYDFGAMKVGQSFFVPESEAAEGKNLAHLKNRILNAARSYGLRTNTAYVTKVVEEARDVPVSEVGDDGDARVVGQKALVKGVRCWRVADPEKPAEEVPAVV